MDRKVDRKEKIQKMFEQGLLINEDFLDKDMSSDQVKKFETEGDLLVMNSDYAKVISQQSSLVDWYEMDQFRAQAEKERNDELYQNQLQRVQSCSLSQQFSSAIDHEQKLISLEMELDQEKLSSSASTTLADKESFSEDFSVRSTAAISLAEAISPMIEGPVKVLISYHNIAHKYAIKDFTNFFLSRYRFLENILRGRQELQNAMAISRILGKTERDKVSLIGLVQDISLTKNGNIILTMEDMTGEIKVLVSKNNPEIFALGNDLVFDEVVGIAGTSGDKIVFAENIIWPDIPSSRELKKGPIEEYVVFLSDIHVGSKLFLKKEFERFLQWISGNAGNDEQKSIARRVKYVIIAGDIVDGIGIYPGQEDELDIKDIVEQYQAFAELISKIPSEKQIIICPGNHDLVHLAEPQSIFYKDYVSLLTQMPNVILVTNPSLVTIGRRADFSGFDVLLYHGSSFDYYIANVESIRNNGGYHRADLVMKFLLKRRHLAPSFTSTPYFPAHYEDPLLIKQIPDFFVTGHIHYSNVANYKSVTMISGSCWQDKTSYQEKLGHEPEPARIPIVNLKTRDIRILKFI